MASNWEEELRKLLEGETAAQPPPPARTPPPIIRREPAPAPPPIIVREVPRHAPPPLPTRVVVHQPQPVIIADDDHEQHEGSGHLATLEEAANAYLRGSQLQEKVAERMHQVNTQTEQHRPTAVASHRSHQSPEVAAVVGLLRQPQTARQVVIASLILAPPKAMEG